MRWKTEKIREERKEWKDRRLQRNRWSIERETAKERDCENKVKDYQDRKYEMLSGNKYLSSVKQSYARKAREIFEFSKNS